MTEQELDNMIKGIATINNMIMKSGVDLSNIEFGENFLSALSGKIFKEEMEKIEEEQSKYRKMKNEFLDQAEKQIKCPYILMENEQNININNKKNYYVVYSENIIYANKEYGSFACVFDKKGSFLLSTDLKGNIFSLGNNDFFVLKLKRNNNNEFFHIQFNERGYEKRHTFYNMCGFKKYGKNFLLIDKLDKNSHDLENELYNIETGEVVVKKIDWIEEKYPVFKNVEPNQFLLITKKIKLLDSDNTATLKFFIDLKGKVVSDVYDLERGWIYSVDQNKEQLEALEDIYQLALKNLEEEKKTITNIYKLKLLKENV